MIAFSVLFLESICSRCKSEFFFIFGRVGDDDKCPILADDGKVTYHHYLSVMMVKFNSVTFLSCLKYFSRILNNDGKV